MSGATQAKDRTKIVPLPALMTSDRIRSHREDSTKLAEALADRRQDPFGQARQNLE